MGRTLWIGLIALGLAACQQKPATQPADAPFGGTARPQQGLIGEIYHLPENADRLPDFVALQPKGVVYARELNVPNRAFTEGFPGLGPRVEWFAIRYRGGFEVAAAGRYGFRLSSDDGSRLLIDDKLVVDNDGLHGVGSKSGEADLAAGAHKIEVQYYQGPREYVALELFCTAPGGQEVLFPGCGATLKAPPTAGWAPSWVLILVVVVVLAGVVFIVVRLTRRRRPA